ncbi:MAG: hypothetical protein ABIG69_09240 [Bacteroidota bacterium]
MPSEVIVNIYSNFPDDNQKKLLKRIVESWYKDEIKKADFENIYNIYVKLFSRYGHTEAKLLLVFFDNSPRGVPFIVKIDELKKIKEELVAIRSINRLVADCSLVIDEEFEENGYGALLLNHKGSYNDNNADKPLTFKDLLFAFSSDHTSENLGKIIDDVFDKLKEAHTYDATKKFINVQDKYDKYFREHKSMEHLNRILGIERDYDHMTLLGSEIDNPIKFVANLPAEIKMNVGRIHGDLHPDNIVMDKNFHPHLIDFAWAEKPRDVLIDYVLLENSIRFNHFPTTINTKEQKEVDELLLNEMGYEDILKLSLGVEMKKYYLRLAALVGEIRTCAKNILGEDFSFEKYLFAQFIVLYGLLKYDSYNQLIATRKLGLIAKKLNEIGTEILLS